MTLERMIELLEIEHECMLRASHGDCARECFGCKLVQNDDELHEMYTNVIGMLREKKEKTGHWIVLEYCANEGIYCSKCLNKIFERSTKPKKKLSNYCPNCGSKNTHFYNPSTEKVMYSD